MNKFCLCLLFFLVSCAGFVDQMHRQIDRQERGEKNRSQTPNDQFSNFKERDRFRPENDRRPIKNPVTYSLGGDHSGQQRLPPVKRDYRPQRYQAKDFVDDDSSGSLFVDNGTSSSLFTHQIDKRSGDMVIINVLEDLRNQISSELNRTFPEKPKPPGKPGKEAEKATQAPPAPSTPESDIDMKVYDKISGTVTEEISKDYILLRGRKDVIFKKEKKSIEIQALVSRKDIMENDYVNSDKLLESKVFILRENQ